MFMFCPQCSQEQISQDSRFCSRCGFLMTGVSQLVSNNGMLSQMRNLPNSVPETPRKKGIRTGGKLLLSGFLLVPLVTLLSIALRFEPTLAILTAILTFWGGLLRIIYAAIFESNNPVEKTAEESILIGAQKLFERNKPTSALLQQNSEAVNEYSQPIQGNWRDTNDLIHTGVTEGNTKSLRKNQ